MVKPVWIPEALVAEDDGVVFIKMMKSCPTTVRLLTGKGDGGSSRLRRPLAKTSVIEDLKQERNKVRNALLANEQNQDLDGKINLGIDERAPMKTASPAALETLPSFASLAAAAVGDVPSTTIRVRLQPGPLFVELTVEGLLYMQQVCAHHIMMHCREVPVATGRTNREPLGMPGLSRCHTGEHKGKYRLRTNKTKRCRSEYFDASGDSAAQEEARRRLDRCRGCVESTAPTSNDTEEIMMGDGEDIVEDE